MYFAFTYKTCEFEILLNNSNISSNTQFFRPFDTAPLTDAQNGFPVRAGNINFQEPIQIKVGNCFNVF
jgi:hypothetical protein